MATYDESRRDYERVMGPELGPIYHVLWNECAILHMRWNEYVELFGKDQEQFDVMNGVAPGFFKSVQDALWEATLLHLCCFADPRKDTLSLDALVRSRASKVVPGLTALVLDAKAKIKFAQDWRNRSIAHLNLDHALEKAARPLAPASRAHVREALTAIKSSLECVEMHFIGSELGFEGTGFNWGGDHLISEMRLIARLRAEREKRIDAGNGTADDFDWQKWN